MIRTLAPDELLWFVARALAYQGHASSMRLARSMLDRVRDASREAVQAHVWHPRTGRPTVGAMLRPGFGQGLDATTELALLWREDHDAAGDAFVRALLAQEASSAFALDLHGVPRGAAEAWRAWLHPHGFVAHEVVQMQFDLEHVPPLGRPYMLDAWLPEMDRVFREVYARSESIEVGDAHWSWRKRHGGRFQPDVWFIAHESPDQPPAGYAFVHGHGGLDASYRIEAAGVVPELRSSSEPARRLVLTVLRELAHRSPWGSVGFDVDPKDRPWVAILEEIGFVVKARRHVLERLPR